MSAVAARSRPPGTARLRLFFALWPEAEAARQLERWAEGAARGTGGRVTRAPTIHLTLAFLGELPAERLGSALSAARRVRGRVHAFSVDQARYWPHHRIVWAGPAKTPAALVALAEALHDALRAEGFELEARPFAAHVTLIRKARAPRALPPLPRVEWRVDEFVLVRSVLAVQGSAYEVLERFALGGGSPSARAPD